MTSGGRLKFCASTSGGVRDIQSVMLNVPNSEKRPSSKISKKWHSSGPSPWIEWPCPFGKYQTSPGPKSEISASPLGAMTVTRQRPLTTYAHSAAIACQWSSRKRAGLQTHRIPPRNSSRPGTR